MKLDSAEANSFHQNGYLVVKELFSNSEVKEMKDACYNLVDKLDPATESAAAFRTGGEQKDRGEYFLTSGDKIRYFYEPGAVDETGSLADGVDKFTSINKIGHALHVLEPTFKKYTFDERIKSLVTSLNILTKPAVCQSMYIFKQPKIGGAVPPHLDATYLYTKPLGKVIGLWIALEDATEENACLWFIPGSHKKIAHKGDVPVRFVRTKDPDAEGCLTKSTGSHPDFAEYGSFIPVPIKAGDAIVIHGLVVHKSEPNTSLLSRHIYTYHLVDQEETCWDPDNWLQPTSGTPFTPLYN